jgi:hypothetical protein
LAGRFVTRSKAKFGHVQPVFCAQCDGRVCFSGGADQRADFFFARKSTFPAKNAESVGQRELRSAPTYRVRKEAQSSTKQGSDPTNTRRTARCGVLLGGRGCGGTYGDAVLYSGWCPGFRLGPLAVTVSFYSHFYIVYMACLSVDLSLSGQVCAGDFPFPALLNRELVRSLPRPAGCVLRRERGDAPAGVSFGCAGDGLAERGD